jgi:hypothetical protein
MAFTANIICSDRGFDNWFAINGEPESATN